MRFLKCLPGHTLKPFDCGDQDLNDFLFNDALVSFSELLTVTYIVEDDEKTLAYFSILNDKVTYEESKLSNRKWKKNIQSTFPEGKSYKSYPALKIGRLAVNEAAKGQRIGTMLIEYIKGLFMETPSSGCRFITVDAYSASVDFYSKNGFVFLTDEDMGKETRLMYFDLKPFTANTLHI